MTDSTKDYEIYTPQEDRIFKKENFLDDVRVSLKDTVYITLHNWPWTVLSVVLCVGLAYLMLLRTPNVYTRSAEIMVKETDRGSSSNFDFSQMGLFSTQINQFNEVSFLSSRDLMKQVVRELHLDVNYFTPGKLTDHFVYGSTLPVKVNLVNYPEESGLAFTLKVNPQGVVSIDELQSHDNDTKKETTFTGHMGDSIVTPFCPIVVTPAEGYVPGQDIELMVRKSPLMSATEGATGRLSVEQNDEWGTVFNIRYSDRSIERADDVLNALIAAYNESWIRDKNQIAVSASHFIDERLAVIESELGNVDSDISSFKSEHLIPDVQAASSMYMTQNRENTATMLELNNQLQMARYIRSCVTADGNQYEVLPANSLMDNAALQGQIAVYNQLMLERNSLISKSSDRNPLVSTIDEQLKTQRQAILRTIDNEIINLTTQLNTLKHAEAHTKSQLASNPNQAKYLLSVERQQKVKESLYLFLLQKREENELSQAFTAYNTRIVNSPGSAGIPVSPNRRNTLAIAFLLGLIIPFGYFYIREYTNTKIIGRKDLAGLTLPFMGEIPQNGRQSDKDKTKDKKEYKFDVTAGSRNVINEAFRVLRTNIEFMRVNKEGAYIISFTSFSPHSGKTYISMNLGRALAIKGNKVLIIDGDMRHGSASQYVGNPSQGLSNYLNGSISDIRSVIVPVADTPALSVVPVGPVPPNPTELLASKRFGQMLEELHSQYDYIIIDCPPIEVVADTQIINKHVDRTVFVVRAGLFEREMLPELESLYGQQVYRNMAVVLNGTDLTHTRSAAHNYRYGYGTKYGYHDYYSKD